MKTLIQIINAEKANRQVSGVFGLNACKEHILFERSYFNKNIYALLGEYVDRVNNDVFFNGAMVLACWELINGL